jgi:hydroxylamine reductase
MSMFCYQCEQTNKGSGCTSKGVCGKEPETSALQDLLLYAARGIASYSHPATQLGAKDESIDVFVAEALFTTVTNVSFDPERLQAQITKAIGVRAAAKSLYEKACQEAGQEPEIFEGPASWTPAEDLPGLMEQAEQIGISARTEAQDATQVGLQELVTYGLKGMAAYADHAWILGKADPKVWAFFHEALAFLNREHTIDELLGMSLKVGEINLRAMELLDAANTGAYGHPEPTSVRTTPIKGKAILISGHDLRDLKDLLEQTEG